MDNPAAQQLKSHGIRPSVQRLAIMQYLMAHRTHPTADRIYSDLQAKIPTLSRTTVYNTLQLLHDHKAVHALSIDSHTVHYDADLTPHAHFMCRCCRAICDLPLAPDVATSPFSDPDYHIEQVQLNYYGVCADCHNAGAGQS